VTAISSAFRLSDSRVRRRDSRFAWRAIGLGLAGALAGLAMILTGTRGRVWTQIEFPQWDNSVPPDLFLSHASGGDAGERSDAQICSQSDWRRPYGDSLLNEPVDQTGGA
jgi:hypothetical protein